MRIEPFISAATIEPTFDRLSLEPFPPTDRQRLDLVVADRRPIPLFGQLGDPVRLVDVRDR